MKTFVLSATTLLAALVVSGCASPQQILQGMEGQAINSALARGQFDLQCPSAQASVLSQELMQPVFFGGPQRGLYTIGVSGCDQRKTYQIICPAGGDGCFAADTLGNVR